MRRWFTQVLLGLALAWFGAWAGAHVRLVHVTNGRPLEWSNPQNLSIVVNDRGSDDVLDVSEEVAIQLAIDEWNQVTGTNLSLALDQSPTQEARTDWQSNGVHLVLFDEDDSSGWFPDGSGTVAVTPIYFDSSGRILDADVLFNGKAYRFTTTGEDLRFDVQDVATHELGHFLGLDHSGCAGASMHPYVDPDNLLHRSLSEDDRAGLRQMEPTGTHASLSGVVRRATGATPVAGAYVVATDAAGRSAGGTLTDASGAFAIEGLLAGTYAVTALPLDEPVAAGNLSSWYTIETDFEPASYGGTTVVATGEALALGTLLVGDDVSVNLGKASDRYPLRAIVGETTALTVRGTGLFSGGTLTCSDPDVLVQPLSWLGSQVTFQLVVPAGEAPGLVDLDFVGSIGRRAFLPGAVELTPPDPVVTDVSPAVGSNLGGTNVFLTGTGFRAGARVVIGDRWYSEASGLVVHDATTLELTTAATEVGLHDVVVIDATGVEGRATAAFEVDFVPSLTLAVPAVGSVAGGTRIRISGENFQPGLVVRIDGVVQSDVTLESSTLLTVVTTGGAAGITTIEVQNPGGESDAVTFEYVASPDPQVAATTPAAGPAAGGTVVEFTGSDLAGVTEVLFGANLATGGVGTPGTALEILDATTVRVTTPAGSPGPVDVLLRDGDSGQAALLTGAFTFRGEGGGGGCGAVAPLPWIDRPGPGSGAWAAVLLALLAVRAKRARALRPTVGTAAGAPA